MFIFIPTIPDGNDFAIFTPNPEEGLPIWTQKKPTGSDGEIFIEKKIYLLFLYHRSLKSGFFRVSLSGFHKSGLIGMESTGQPFFAQSARRSGQIPGIEKPAVSVGIDRDGRPDAVMASIFNSLPISRDSRPGDCIRLR